ncbi:MAG: 50S ribosomal protein L29 [Chloroflexi bacterium]|nr:50S ribosomal protein L29 [Chloroflexota bacterium]
MQAREIRTWTTEEMQEHLDDAYRELFALRRELAMGRLEDYTRVRSVKHDIARIKTILRERELVAELVEEAA